MEEPSYTSRRGLLNLIIGGIGCLSLLPFRPAQATAPDMPEGLSPPEYAEVARVLAGDTLELKNGDRLRLAGIETPGPDLAPGDPRMAKLTENAKATLESLVGSGQITLRFDALQRDRYGRRLAHVFDAAGTWVQGGMVAAGQARVHGDPRNRRGLPALLRQEAIARDDRRGIWTHPVFAVRGAADPALVRLAGSFQIVRGQVFAATVVKGTGFINFGADRQTDLTLVLKNPNLDWSDPAMLDLSWLTGKPVRCRGWLDRYDGPRIDVSYPEQIEVLET